MPFQPYNYSDIYVRLKLYNLLVHFFVNLCFLTISVAYFCICDVVLCLNWIISIKAKGTEVKLFLVFSQIILCHLHRYQVFNKQIDVHHWKRWFVFPSGFFCYCNYFSNFLLSAYCELLAAFLSIFVVCSLCLVLCIAEVFIKEFRIDGKFVYCVLLFCFFRRVLLEVVHFNFLLVKRKKLF